MIDATTFINQPLASVQAICDGWYLDLDPLCGAELEAMEDLVTERAKIFLPNTDEAIVAARLAANFALLAPCMDVVDAMVVSIYNWIMEYGLADLRERGRVWERAHNVQCFVEIEISDGRGDEITDEEMAMAEDADNFRLAASHYMMLGEHLVTIEAWSEILILSAVSEDGSERHNIGCMCIIEDGGGDDGDDEPVEPTPHLVA